MSVVERKPGIFANIQFSKQSILVIASMLVALVVAGNIYYFSRPAYINHVDEFLNKLDTTVKRLCHCNVDDTVCRNAAMDDFNRMNKDYQAIDPHQPTAAQTSRLLELLTAFQDCVEHKAINKSSFLK